MVMEPRLCIEQWYIIYTLQLSDPLKDKTQRPQSPLRTQYRACQFRSRRGRNESALPIHQPLDYLQLPPCISRSVRGFSEAVARASRAAALAWCPLVFQIHKHAAGCAGKILPVRQGSMRFQVVSLPDSRLHHTSPCRVARGLCRNHSRSKRAYGPAGGGAGQDAGGT